MKPAIRIQVPDTSAFRAALEVLAARLHPQVCVETGTHLGLGSTQFLLGLASRYPIEKIYTVEVSRTLHDRARANLADHPVVECLWGLTVEKGAAKEFIAADPLLRERGAEPDIYIDFLPDPVAGYLRELDGAVGGDDETAPQDGLLATLLEQVRGRRPLICLDSAGGLGLLEFEMVQSLMGDSVFGLWLDDINHVKHYRSMRRVQEDPRAEVLGTNWEEGWLVALYNAVGS